MDAITVQPSETRVLLFRKGTTVTRQSIGAISFYGLPNHQATDRALSERPVAVIGIIMGRLLHNIQRLEGHLVVEASSRRESGVRRRQYQIFNPVAVRGLIDDEIR